MPEKDKASSDILTRSFLAKQLQQIAVLHPSTLIYGDGRQAVMGLMKSALKDGYALAEKHLLDHGSGAKATAEMSANMDAVLQSLADFTEQIFLPKLKPEQFHAIIAVGGYGRGKLAPHSDVDLLFIMPRGGGKVQKQLIEYVLYLLWDCGLKVGHATRTIEECVDLARSDTTICTTLLESRFLWGNELLYKALDASFYDNVVAGTSAHYIDAKLTERDERHKKIGDTRYMVEPNIKEGKGGLRDIQTLFWITKYFYQIHQQQELVRLNVLTRRELNKLNKAIDFLWAVRCHLHFVTGKAEERLSFDYQREIATRLGYQDHPGLSGVERFMKHYFLIAKNVGDLTRILCAALEEEKAKSSPTLDAIAFGAKMLGAITGKGRKRKIAGSDFSIENGRLIHNDADIFKNNPINLIGMFALARKQSALFHPELLKLASRSLKLINADLRNNPDANALFIEVLTAGDAAEFYMRRMNEAGILGRFVPEFGKIVAMMQFSMYHSYTVDEHSLRTIDVLNALLQGKLDEAHPLTAKILPDLIPHKRLLYVALFLHDIAKGRPEDHSIAGAKVAAKLCPRFGLTPAETKTIMWLVENHLVMSTVAQTRDLQDRKTIEDFAATVQSMERMRLLLVLTICDIRSVGPGVWTGWKGQLLRTLYNETELVLTGGFSDTSRDQRAASMRARLDEALADWPESRRQHYIKLYYRNTLLALDQAQLEAHSRFLFKADEDNKKLAFDVHLNTFEDVTELTVAAPDHPRLLSVIAGACSGAGANIVAAQISTLSDGRALDVIRIAREFSDDADEQRRASRIGTLIEDVLSGKASLPDTINRQKRKKFSKAFEVEPKVNVRNALSHRYSVIEVEGLNRIGILAEITRALSDLSLDIESAQITTYGEKIIDTFYVTDLMGFKIDSPSRQRTITRRLTEVIESGVPGVGKNWTPDDKKSAAIEMITK